MHIAHGSYGLQHSSFAPRLLVHPFALLVAVRHSTLHTPILAKVPTDRTQHPRWLARRRRARREVRRHRSGVRSDALREVIHKDLLSHKQVHVPIHRATLRSSSCRAPQSGRSSSTFSSSPLRLLACRRWLDGLVPCPSVHPLLRPRPHRSGSTALNSWISTASIIAVYQQQKI